MSANVTFWKLLKKFGVGRILFGTDLICSVIFTTLFYIGWIFYDFIRMNKDIFMVTIGVSAGMFGLLFGAFSIMIALSDEKFILFLKKAKIFDNLLFPFWYVSVLYLISIFLDLIVILTYDIGRKYKSHEWLVVIAIFFSFYSLLSTFHRIAATIKFGVYRSKVTKE